MDALSTVDCAVDLLFHLNAQPAPQGVTALARALGFPKTNTHRLLATLTRRGLLERDERGRYRPGLGLVALGVGVLEREPVVQVARPVLEAVAHELGETVFLTAPRAGRIVVLAKVEGRGFLRAAPRIGSEVPVHATAVGKLALAFAPGSVDPLPGEQAPFTAQTLRTRTALAAEVRRVRALGWAENHGEWIAGLSVVAAPISAHRRHVGALALAAPSPRMSALGSEAVSARVVAAARRIGAQLDGAQGDGLARGGAPDAVGADRGATPGEANA